MLKGRAFVFVLGLIAATVGGTTVEAAPEDAIVIKAAELHTGTGQVIPNGMLIVADGRIVDVGSNLTPPPNATVIHVPAGSITPGLIDANAAVEATNVMTPQSPGGSGMLHGIFRLMRGQKDALDCGDSTSAGASRQVDERPCEERGLPEATSGFAVGTRPWVSLAEQSSEVIPHTRVIDSVNLRSVDFDRLLDGGVTTVFVSPDSAAVIGSQGAIVRTGGPVGDRIIRETYAVKAVMGTEPSQRGVGNVLPWRENVTFYARRPTTRMGVTWVFRKAFHDTRRRETGLKVYGADMPSDAAMDVLSLVLKGGVPLRIQARMQHDILTALRLAAEFDLSFILEEGTEAYLCLDELKASGTPVIYGPIYIRPPGDRAATLEVDKARLHTMKALLDAGVEVALTAHELRDEDGLARQAMCALRYGSSLAEVTKAVTQTPARLLGIGDEIGTLEKGKRADVVLWSGRPFEATSKPVVVLIGGQVVLERRKG
jgi:imidazolonepropionase-like amidohydrolase